MLVRIVLVVVVVAPKWCSPSAPLVLARAGRSRSILGFGSPIRPRFGIATILPPRIILLYYAKISSYVCQSHCLIVIVTYTRGHETFARLLSSTALSLIDFASLSKQIPRKIMKVFDLTFACYVLIYAAIIYPYTVKDEDIFLAREIIYRHS